MSRPTDIPVVLTIGDGTIEVFEASTRITLADGSTVLAVPEDTADYRATALQTGYEGDTTTLCKEHEIMHLALADLLKVCSPTMEHVGSVRPWELWVREMEEDAVLAIQRYSRARNIDLVRLFQRASKNRS